LAHSYRTLHHWDKWLAGQFLGERLLEEELRVLSQLLKRHYGKHALLLGVPHQHVLLKASDIACHYLMTPLTQSHHDISQLESDFHALPILTGSIDLVLLPHTLELIDHPRQLLVEACRIVKPEGLIVISGFNPYSLWGLKKMPWAKHCFSAQKIKGWLRLAEFELEQQQPFLFTPPVDHPTLYQKMKIIESIGRQWLPGLGGAYTLVARAKVTPMTPIRLKWKQTLSNIRITPTLPGHIARRSK
jgi:SAM-dependent methyltransferase